MVVIKLRCPYCGGKASLGYDDRGPYGICNECDKIFDIKVE